MMPVVPEYIKNFIFNLKIPEEIINDSMFCDVVHNLEQQIREANLDFLVSAGASKICIIPSDWNYVIKIPFSGYYWEDGSGEYSNFRYADDLGSGRSEWDYCDNELAKYDLAAEAGFNDFFAKMWYYTDIMYNTPIYIQEKVTPLCNVRSINSSDEARTYYQNHRIEMTSELDKSWILNAIDYYGGDEVLHFILYLDDSEITDLHNENVGFNAAGAPVILDWAGWRD